MHKGIFITVRTGSTRLPNKALLKINGKPTIEHLIDRVKRTKLVDTIILCTTTLPEDDILCEIAEKNNIFYYRGSVEDKLERWLGACKKYDIDFFVTADGDDLFCEPKLIELALRQCETSDVEFIQGDNLVSGCFTYGIRRSALEKVCEIKDTSDTEMMWVYFTDTGLFDVQYLQNVPKEYKRNDIRMTLDYEDDLKFFTNVIEHFDGKIFDLLDVFLYINDNPDVAKINYYLEDQWSVNQKEKIKLMIKKDNDKGWRFNNNERKYVDKVLSGNFSAGDSGTYVQQLEKLFAEKHNQKYAIGCNSGTSTLHTALEAFGVGPGDEVIIPSLTVAMCGFVVLQCGAMPVYTDVKKDTFLMDSKDVEKKITSKTKAIMPVHMYGLMCDMDEIMDVAKRHGLYVLEDSAQCFLGNDDKNRISGTIGHAGSWSFENSKHMTSGDGGILTTDDAILSDHMRKFAWLGYKNITELSSNVRVDKNLFQTPTWTRHIINSYNYRLPELCAAVALAQLENLDYFCKLRHEMGMGYESVITDNNSDMLLPQKTPYGYKNSYYTFAAVFNGEKYGIDWHEFREKYMSFGGDGIFGALQLVGNEPSFKYNKIGWGITPVAKELQKKLMLFTTNQANDDEINIQMDCLDKTLKYYKV